MSTNKTFNKVQLDVKFTQATSRANLISEENISISFGKISKYFADLHSQAFTGYTHPTYIARTGKPTGNQTPGFGSTFTISQITSDETGHVTAATDRTVKIPDTTMGAASADAAGSKGLVPAPAAGKQTSFLRGDGTWVVPTNTDTKVTQSTTTTANYRPILFGAKNSTDVSTLADTITDQAYTSTKMFAKPDTGNLYATEFITSSYLSGTGADLAPYGLYLKSQKQASLPAGGNYGYARYALRVHDGKAIDNNGMLLTMDSGGLTIVGSGESATALATLISDDQRDSNTSRTRLDVGGTLNTAYTGTNEQLILSSDNNIYLLTNCNTIADRKPVVLDTASRFYPGTTNTGSIGIASYQWNTIYGKTILENGTSLASKYAAIGHTHATTMAADSGTNQLTLEASTKYKLTAGETNFIFTTPPNTTYSAGAHLSLSSTTFSLASYCKSITDWNSATTNGWYMGYSVTNAPSTAWWFGRVVAHNNKYCMQEVWQFTASTDGHEVPHKMRMFVNNVWGNWVDVTVGTQVPENAVFTDHITTVTSSGSGNAVTAISADANGALTVTKGSTFSLSTHTHGLLHSNLNQTATNGTTGGWSVIGIDPAVTGYVLKSIRVNTTSPDWLSGDYGAGIAFGGSDTKGVISMKYQSPVITFAGGSHNSSRTKPIWYLKISGTSGSTYNLANFYDSTISRTANTVLAAPNGSNGTASFRKLVAADIPYLNYSGVASSWWNDRDNAVIRLTKADSSYRPLWSLLTSTTGSWAVGNFNNDDLVFNFISKATYDTGSNPASDAYKQVKFTNAGGITTTGAITASDTGTFKTGDFGTQLIVERSGNPYFASLGFKNSLGMLGYIAANAVDTSLYHIHAGDTSKQYIILDTGNTSVTTSGSGNAITALSFSNGTFTATKGSTFSLSTHTHSNYLPMSTVSSSTDADTLFTTSQWINWNTTTEVETTHMPTTNYGILLAKAYPGIQVFIPDSAAGIYFRKKTNANTAATAWWGIKGTAGNTYNLANFLTSSTQYISSIASSGSGNAVTSMSVAGGKLTYTLGSTFSLDGHDNKCTVTNGSTTSTNYGIIFAANPNTTENNTLRKTNDFRYQMKDGAANVEGFASIVLGNTKKLSEANNKSGNIYLYSSGGNWHLINTTSATSNITHTLPATSGTILNSGTTSFTRTLSSGTKIGTIKINGTSTDLYCQTNTNTTYSAGTGLSLSGTTFNHSNSVTAVANYNKPYVKYDAQGHITGSSYWTATAAGTGGENGWIKVATMVHTGNYDNTPIMLLVSQRGNTITYKLHMVWKNAGNTNPDIHEFLLSSDIDINADAYIKKSTTSTWELYIKKIDPYDAIAMHLYVGKYFPDHMTWTWKDVQTAESAITGGIEAEKIVPYNYYQSRTANTVLAAPNGSAGTATFRKLVAADIPALSYLPTAGGAITGKISSAGAGSSWWNDRDNAVFRITTGDSSYRPLWSLLTATTGSWAMGNHTGDDLTFNFISKAVYDTSANPSSNKHIKFTNAGGITTTGGITSANAITISSPDFGNQLIINRNNNNTGYAAITFKSATSATATASTLGYIGIKAVDGDLYRIDGSNTGSDHQYPILDTHNYTTYCAKASHTHKYAGSSSAGGAATSANKLNTNAGATNRPVYFSGGVPVQCDTPESKTWFKGVPLIKTDGVMEIGKIIDFHKSNDSTADYDLRLQYTGSATGKTITLPGASGNVALLAKGGTSYYGMLDGDGSTSGWIRATSNGFLPSASAKFFQTATSSLGTSSWYFKNSYIQYMNANSLVLGAAKTADGAAKGQLKFFSGNGSDATGTVTLECADDAVHTGDYTVKLPTWNGTIPVFEKLFEGASNTVSLSYSDIDEYDVFLITVANSNATSEPVTVTSLWISNVAGIHDMPLIWGGAPTSSGGSCNVTSGWIQLSKNSGTTTFVVAHKPNVAQMTSSGWTISSPTYNLYIRKIFGLKAFKRT